MEREGLGDRLRALRLSKQRSISELSRLSGIGKGTISELENGKRDARLETLFTLTTALQAPLGAVLSSDDDELPVRGDSVHAVLLASWLTEHERIEVYRARLTEHRQLSAAHAPGVEETVTVLSGSIRIGPDDQNRVLGPGESLRYPGDHPHSFSSLEGDASALLVMHYPITTKEVTE